MRTDDPDLLSGAPPGAGPAPLHGTDIPAPARSGGRGVVVVAVLLGLVLGSLAVALWPRQDGDPDPGSDPGRDPSRDPSSDPSGVPAGWRLDLVEDFDTLDRDRWNVADGWGAANESSWLQADNVSVADGVLRVQGRDESAGGRDHTSGRLDTNGTYALPDTFRAEVRAKVPFQQGLWAAPLWLRPVDGAMGEIDLVETYGAERDRPVVHQTIHSAYGDDHDFVARDTPFADIGSKAATDWHTYTVEKVPGRITMWVDGVRTARFTSADAPWFDEYYETGTRWNLRVNMQIGGSYGMPDGGTDWSGDDAVMQVDRIRTWVPG